MILSLEKVISHFGIIRKSPDTQSREMRKRFQSVDLVIYEI